MEPDVFRASPASLSQGNFSGAMQRIEAAWRDSRRWRAGDPAAEIGRWTDAEQGTDSLLLL